MTKFERYGVVAGIIGTVIAGAAFFYDLWKDNRPSKVPEPMPSPLAGPLPTPVKPELLISKLTTGMSRKSVEAVFGVPMFAEPNQQYAVDNLIFVFPNFFLQTIISSEQKVLFYSVTTRGAGFQPEVPKLGGHLTSAKFVSFGEGDTVYSDATSKYYEYAEKHVLGNAGNYRTIYLGYCPSGAAPDWNKFAMPLFGQDDASAMHLFRTANSPNCYGVGDINGDVEALIQSVRIGLDYYQSRDLPTN